MDLTDLVEGGIGELENVNHANNLACFAHDGQVKIVTI